MIIHGDLRKKLETTFDVYDINKNGRIERNEMEKILVELFNLVGDTKMLKEKSISQIVDEIISSFDQNADGNLDSEEFIQVKRMLNFVKKKLE